MMIEIQAIVIGVLANLVGDQILIMLLAGALHIWGRRCGAGALAAPADVAGIATPDGARTGAGAAGLRPPADVK